MGAATSELIGWYEQITERYVPPAPRELPELRAKIGRCLDGIGSGFYLPVRGVERINGRER